MHVLLGAVQTEALSITSPPVPAAASCVCVFASHGLLLQLTHTLPYTLPYTFLQVTYPQAKSLNPNQTRQASRGQVVFHTCKSVALISIMPSHYNTRRKSLSLPSLGIHVPVTNAARAAAANRASSNNNNTSSHSNSNSSSRHHSPATMASPAPSTASMSSNSRDNAPPSKKLKRVHTQDSEDRAQPRHKKRDSTAKMHNTPPPSPGAEQQSIEMDDAPMSKPIDLKAIGDEIVEAVIVQLQNNGNKPQLVKNLVPILMRQLKIVQQ